MLRASPRAWICDKHVPFTAEPERPVRRIDHDNTHDIHVNQTCNKTFDDNKCLCRPKWQACAAIWDVGNVLSMLSIASICRYLAVFLFSLDRAASKKRGSGLPTP